MFNATLSYLDSAFTIDGYSTLKSYFDFSSVSLEAANQLVTFLDPNKTLEQLFQYYNTLASPAKSRDEFLASVCEEALDLRYKRYLEASLEEFFNTVMLKDILIHLAFEYPLTTTTSSGEKPLLKYLDSRFSTDVDLAGLGSRGVDTLINEWIEENKRDWLEKLPLSRLAKNWVMEN